MRSDNNDCDVPLSISGFGISNETRTFISDGIDISCAGNVTFSIDVEGIGPMEPADFINIFYVVDGDKLTASEDTDRFSKKQLSHRILWVIGLTLSSR